MLGSGNKQYDVEDTSNGMERVQTPNAFFSFWQSKLANPDLINLQTSSGAIAPSEGVIVSRDGKVVTQSVGYGDDHYLPFDMAKLSKVKGGDYVRTRTLGGLTTEDIYAGMISGARSVNVVSHSGTFTLEFDPSFRGARRLNDKARRMSTRYGKLVDSLASGEVKINDVPADRRAEIEEQVYAEIGGDSPEIRQLRQQKINDALDEERQHPTPSARTKEDWTNEFGIAVAEKYHTADGVPMSWTDVKSQASQRTGRVIEDDVEAINELGMGAQYDKFMANKERAYARENSPLRLNGEGYRNAMMALKEQFPYYIKEVNWIPPNSAAAGRTDVGYVKPKHLRSENIMEGYWNPTIEGYEGEIKTPSGKTSGKRTADRENYANANAYERLGVSREAYPKRKQKEPDDQDFSAGGGNQAASASTATVASQTASTGANVSTGSFGPMYTEFEPSPKLAASKTMTDYDTLEQAVKVRNAMRSAGKIPYHDATTGAEVTFQPFSAAGLGQLAIDNDVKALFANPQSDADFKNSVIQGQVPIENVRAALENMGKATEGPKGALATLLNGKNLLASPVPQNPNSAVALASDLQNGLKREYDFGKGNKSRFGGEYYLPGLAKREYKAVWMTDPDIQKFVGTSNSRFGYDMSLNKHASTFDKMSVNLGKAANEALSAAQQWRREISQYGSPAKTPSRTSALKYGGKTYSIYGVADLERDVANDVLAVAKMTQLKRQYASSTDKDEEAIQNPDMKVISLDQMQEDEADAASYNPDKDPRDKPVGDLKFGDQPESRSGKVTAIPLAKDPDALKQASDSIHNMIGLDSVKTEFDDLLKESRVNEYRKEKGLGTRSTTKHLIFAGNPGTGKTTVAGNLGKAYHAMGLIPNDNIEVLTRADLISPYQGQTAARVRSKFQQGKGGVIFIDEAYSLINGPDDSYGYEAVDELVTQIENNRDDTVVILAGYGDEMQGFLQSNPGLASRFPRTIKFPNYKAKELNAIGEQSLEADDYYLDDGADYAKAMRRIATSPNPANGRDVRNFNDAVIRAQNRRVSRLDKEDADIRMFSEITPVDVQNATKEYFKTRTSRAS